MMSTTGTVRSSLMEMEHRTAPTTCSRCLSCRQMIDVFLFCLPTQQRCCFDITIRRSLKITFILTISFSCKVAQVQFVNEKRTESDVQSVLMGLYIGPFKSFNGPGPK